MYINDLPSRFSSPAMLFADDLKLALPTADPDTAHRDIRALSDWVEEPMMILNLGKCQQLHLGSAPPLHISLPSANGVSPIAVTSMVSDHGVLIGNTLSPAEQINHAVQKARAVLFMIRRRFFKLTKSIFEKVYSALVRPHLEYAVQAWAAFLKRDICKLESVQRLATRMVWGLRSLPYEERLSRLGLV